MTFISQNKVIYLNNTAISPHIGCMAVTDYHLEAMCGHGLEISDMVYCHFPWISLWKGDRDSSVNECLESTFGQRLAAADLVVINGEGTLHHGPGRGILTAAAAALQLGKPVHLVNTSIFGIEGFDDILARLSDLNVRELESSRLLTERGIPHRVVFDSFLGANFSTKPDRDYAGKTIVMDWHPGRDRDTGRTILDYYDQLGESQRQFLPLNHYSHIFSWQNTVANLEASRMILTGRYHGVYLAGLAGRPFVALPSNTPKIQGLIQGAKLPLPFCDHPRELDEKIKYAYANPSIFSEFQSFLKEQRPLATFDPLVKESQKDALPFDSKIAAQRKSDLLEKIHHDREFDQFRHLFEKNKERVELTPKKQLKLLAKRAFRKMRSKFMRS